MNTYLIERGGSDGSTQVDRVTLEAFSTYPWWTIAEDTCVTIYRNGRNLIARGTKQQILEAARMGEALRFLDTLRGKSDDEF